MRRFALPVAAAALVALVAVAALQLLAPSHPATRAEVAASIAADLRCPDCQGLSVAESRTAAAAAIRSEIDEQLAAGVSPDAVRVHFVERYGQWILLSPRGALAWLLPVAALAFGVAALGWVLLRRNASVPSANRAPGSITEGERQRVRDEAEALDA